MNDIKLPEDDELTTGFMVANHIIDDFSHEDMVYMVGYGLKVIKNEEMKYTDLNELINEVRNGDGIVRLAKEMQAETSALLAEFGIEPHMVWLEESKEKKDLEYQKQLQQSEVLRRQEELNRLQALSKQPSLMNANNTLMADIMAQQMQMQQQAQPMQQQMQMPAPVQPLEMQKAPEQKHSMSLLDRYAMMMEQSTAMQEQQKVQEIQKLYDKNGVELTIEQAKQSEHVYDKNGMEIEKQTLDALYKSSPERADSLELQKDDKTLQNIELEKEKPSRGEWGDRVVDLERTQTEQTIELEKRQMDANEAQIQEQQARNAEEARKRSREENERLRAGTIASMKGLDINLAREGVDKSIDDGGTVAVEQNTEIVNHQEVQEMREEKSASNDGAEVTVTGEVIEETKPNFLDNILKDEEEEEAWKNDPVLQWRAAMREDEEDDFFDETQIKTKG